MCVGELYEYHILNRHLTLIISLLESIVFAVLLTMTMTTTKSTMLLFSANVGIVVLLLVDGISLSTLVSHSKHTLSNGREKSQHRLPLVLLIRIICII